MTPLLAEASVSPETLGVTVLALITLTRWLWDYNRDRREEREASEPRAKPPLHQTYATKEEHAELKGRVDGVETKLEDNFRELDRKRSVSIAGLHDDLSNCTERLRGEMKEDNQGLHNRLTEIIGEMREMKGRIEGKR